MERMNRRGRSEVLQPGETVVVYVPVPGGATASNATPAPVPDLPPLP